MKYSGIGGQAVIEGVMMRNEENYAVAVRKPDNEIEIKKEKKGSIRDKYKFFNVPIIRGVVSFVESLIVGMGTLNYSASFYEEEEGKESDSSEKDAKKDSIVMGLVMAVAIIAAIGIFVVVPYLIGQLLQKVIPSTILCCLIEGVIRVVLFITYVKLISLMQDIKRVFMYHGAEHKSINCIENGLELTVENVKKQTTAHKRCGTSFMLIVMLISILFFMFINVDSGWLRMVLRILLVPVIAGISFEFIRFAGKHDNKVINVLSKPGLWLQSLTTAEPTEDMIEVAIASVNAVFDWKAFLEEAEAEVEEVAEESQVEMVEEVTEEPEVETVATEEKEDDIEILDLEDDEEDDEILNALDRYFESPTGGKNDAK